MANQAQFVLQVSDFTLAGIDKTNRILRVRGNAIPIIAPGSFRSSFIVHSWRKTRSLASRRLCTLSHMPPRSSQNLADTLPHEIIKRGSRLTQS